MPQAPPEDARAMVRRYVAHEARRKAALRIALIGGLGAGLVAVALARQWASRNAATSGGAFTALPTAAQDVTHKLQTLAHDAKTQLTKAQSESLEFTKEPLAFGVVSLALGLAAAALWPLSETERRLLSPARRRVVERASDLAGDTAQQVRAVVQDAIATVTPPRPEAVTEMAGSASPGSPQAKPRRRRKAAPSPVTQPSAASEV